MTEQHGAGSVAKNRRIVLPCPAHAPLARVPEAVDSGNKHKLGMAFREHVRCLLDVVHNTGAGNIRFSAFDLVAHAQHIRNNGVWRRRDVVLRGGAGEQCVQILWIHARHVKRSFARNCEHIHCALVMRCKMARAGSEPLTHLAGCERKTHAIPKNICERLIAHRTAGLVRTGSQYSDIFEPFDQSGHCLFLSVMVCWTRQNYTDYFVFFQWIAVHNHDIIHLYQLNRACIKNYMKKQITVFLVEDDKDLADIYCTKFKQAGFICQHMQTGSGATEMIQKNIPDVAILDVMLPQKNGFEILQEIRANIKTKHMPVIMLTSLGNGFDVRQGIKNGADKYLVKTEVTPTQIVEEINNLLK
ncbi:TPA: hypothetical protein DCZ32_00380 [Candidatus Uhrbacteria bacterium]|nr:hypothetical protein [Candidatus Uhrbacteria bacterium]